MFEKKRILILLATSALLVACGGGGGNDTPASAALTTGNGAATTGAGASTTGTGNTQPTGSGTDSTNSSNTTLPSTTGNPSPPSNPVSTTAAVTDQQLKGILEVVANQILYIRRNRVIYLPVVLDELESDRGIVDVAAGSISPAPLNIDAAGAGCNPAIDGTCAVQPPATAPAAPIAAFGVRISKFVLQSTPGQSVGNQTVVGRIAVDLTERNETPGVGANEVPEIMRFVIDKVELATNQNGELTSVKVQDGAQIHVYGRNAAGVEVRENIPAPGGTVRILPLTDAPDSHGDTTSFYLFLDLETGFSQAGQKLAALHNIAGHFSMNVTLSSVQALVRPAADGVGRKDLVGQPITVNDQPPVSGAGLVGNAWIRMYPSQ